MIKFISALTFLLIYLPSLAWCDETNDLIAQVLISGLCAASDAIPMIGGLVCLDGLLQFMPKDGPKYNLVGIRKGKCQEFTRLEHKDFYEVCAHNGELYVKLNHLEVYGCYYAVRDGGRDQCCIFRGDVDQNSIRGYFCNGAPKKSEYATYTTRDMPLFGLNYIGYSHGWQHLYYAERDCSDRNGIMLRSKIESDDKCRNSLQKFKDVLQGQPSLQFKYEESNCGDCAVRDDQHGWMTYQPCPVDYVKAQERDCMRR